jgi:hypothetical protein
MCAICHERVEPGAHDAQSLPCSHKRCASHFHSACIQQWLRRQRSCPLCKRSVPMGSCTFDAAPSGPPPPPPEPPARDDYYIYPESNEVYNDALHARVAAAFEARYGTTYDEEDDEDEDKEDVEGLVREERAREERRCREEMRAAVEAEVIAAVRHERRTFDGARFTSDMDAHEAEMEAWERTHGAAWRAQRTAEEAAADAARAAWEADRQAREAARAEAQVVVVRNRHSNWGPCRSRAVPLLRAVIDSWLAGECSARR